MLKSWSNFLSSMAYVLNAKWGNLLAHTLSISKCVLTWCKLTNLWTKGKRLFGCYVCKTCSGINHTYCSVEQEAKVKKTVVSNVSMHLRQNYRMSKWAKLITVELFCTFDFYWTLKAAILRHILLLRETLAGITGSDKIFLAECWSGFMWFFVWFDILPLLSDLFPP